MAIKRDLSKTPTGQVGFDDMCDLQDYFDALEIHTAEPPRVVSAVDLENVEGPRSIRGGRERFLFDDEFLVKRLRRVLEQNWRMVPEEITSAEQVELEVSWSEKAGSKRVVTDQPAEIGAVGRQRIKLPYHVCLSELLYGEPLYRQRRVMWNLPMPKPATQPPPPNTAIAVPSPVSGE